MEGPPQIPTGADYHRAMRIRLMPLVRVCADAHSYAVDGVVRFTFVWRGSEGEITGQIRRWWGQLGGHEDLGTEANDDLGNMVAEYARNNPRFGEMLGRAKLRRAESR